MVTKKNWLLKNKMDPNIDIDVYKQLWWWKKRVSSWCTITLVCLITSSFKFTFDGSIWIHNLRTVQRLDYIFQHTFNGMAITDQSHDIIYENERKFHMYNVKLMFYANPIVNDYSNEKIFMSYGVAPNKSVRNYCWVT